MAKSAKKMLPYCAIKFTNIDEYHASLAPEIVKKLDELRQLILKAIPNVTECISYKCPHLKFKKTLFIIMLIKKILVFIQHLHQLNFLKVN